jgi:hypothetical protein
MRHWAVLVSADRFDAERVYRHDVLEVDGAAQLREGDRVALVADIEAPVIFAYGVVCRASPRAAANPDDPESPPAEGAAVISYTSRLLDEARPVRRPDGPVTPLSADAFPPWPARTGPTRRWLVSLDLPIEAETAAEASRLFWTYVRELGPRELPTFVSPSDDELAMQALVAGEPVNLDPEEDD